MFDPEKVRVVMDELCEQMQCRICNDVCTKCPLNTNKQDTIDNTVSMFNKEL